LPRKLKFRDQHEDDQNEVEVAHLEHLGDEGGKIDAAGKCHAHGVAPEDAAGANKRADGEENVLSKTVDAAHHEHCGGDKCNRRH